MASDTQVERNVEPKAEQNRARQWFCPNVDILEQQDELTLVADLSGVAAEGIEIDFEDGVLSIRGKVEPRWPDNAQFLLMEYGIGDFQRTFRLGEQIDASRIHAEHGNGVLTVHLPKVEAAKPRKIEIARSN